MVDWRISDGPVAYAEAVAAMEAQVAGIRAGREAERVWLLEHPPLYTGGTSADPAELLDPDRFPIFASGRGGRYTYHGPGQRIAYVMLDLGLRGRDVRGFVHSLEEWVIRALAHFDVAAVRRDGRVGLWVTERGREEKIAAIGVRVRHWVTFHGVAINVAPDLSHFSGIVPCGLGAYGVTSLAALGRAARLDDLDQALRDEWEGVFPETR